MRELRLYPSKSKVVKNVVHRVQFVADGSALVGWVDESGDFSRPETLCASALFRCSLVTGAADRLHFPNFGDGVDGPFADAALSPDGLSLVVEMSLEGGDGNMLLVYDQRQESAEFAIIGIDTVGFAGVFFTPDGSALVAVHTLTGGEETVREITRFSLSQFTAPVKRYTRNPLTGAKVPVRNLKWKTLIAATGWDQLTTAALSANGRFLAAAEESGTAHIVDLRTKRLLAPHAPVGKPGPDRVVMRLAFDPRAKWLVRLANGKLFAGTVTGAQGWLTAHDFGYVNDFAFHPSGRVLCAACADGYARTLDPLTGKALQAFRWGKNPLYSVAYSPDGLTCAAGGENGRVVVWDVD